jgi:hypothetical protein
MPLRGLSNPLGMGAARNGRARGPTQTFKPYYDQTLFFPEPYRAILELWLILKRYVEY